MILLRSYYVCLFVCFRFVIIKKHITAVQSLRKLSANFFRVDRVEVFTLSHANRSGNRLEWRS